MKKTNKAVRIAKIAVTIQTVLILVICGYLILNITG